MLHFGRVHGEKTNINPSERGNMSVSTVIWFTNTDAESDFFFNEETIDKFQLTLSAKNYMKLSRFGGLTFTEHI